MKIPYRERRVHNNPLKTNKQTNNNNPESVLFLLVFTPNFALILSVPYEIIAHVDERIVECHFNCIVWCVFSLFLSLVILLPYQPKSKNTSVQEYIHPVRVHAPGTDGTSRAGDPRWNVQVVL